LSLLLLIETSSALSSVALAQDDRLLALKKVTEPKSQASQLAPLIQMLLREQMATLAQCDAVAVSAGPGSYTGLRVGLSTAKGVCFGGGKPLIAVNSLDILVQNCIDILDQHPQHLQIFPPNTLIVPMMDARRMEVYTACYQMDGTPLSPPEAMMVHPHSFDNILNRGPVIFTGDGVQKCAPLLDHPNAHFKPLHPSASGMRFVAYRTFLSQNFADLAYFEPYYLKDFRAACNSASDKSRPTMSPF